MTSLLNRFYDSVRSAAAAEVLDGGAQRGFEHLSGHKYCLLVTFKRSTEAVPTPVWFGQGERKLFVRTDAGAAKVRRISHDPHVLVAPCSARGRPLGPSVKGRARVLRERSEQARAEAALQAHYGLGRKLYKRIAARRAVATTYLEIVADP